MLWEMLAMPKLKCDSFGGITFITPWVYIYIHICVCVCVCLYIYLKMFYLYFFDYIFHFNQSFFCKLFWSCHCQYFCFYYLNLFIFNWRVIAFCWLLPYINMILVFCFCFFNTYEPSFLSGVLSLAIWEMRQCGHSDTQIHSQGGIRPWDSEICRMKVSKDAMAAVFGFTPKGRKHRVGRAEWQPGSRHLGVCSPDMWAGKSGRRGEQRRLALLSPPAAWGGDPSTDAWVTPA